MSKPNKKISFSDDTNTVVSNVCGVRLKTGKNAGKKCTRNAKFNGRCWFHKKKE